ncbi:MAG: phospholipid carrier-dependent glycosyltransferase, partial [Planctomycetota bacterium]
MAQSPWLHIAIIITVATTVFFTSLGKARLWDRDEPRNAGCAAEMMERGDFVVPIFNDELRHQKPALLYWLMISAYSIFGVNEFGARFWSALLGVSTSVLTYGIAARLFDRRTALLSGLAICTSIMFCVASRAATPDSPLIFFSTLGIYFYVAGTFSPGIPDGFQLKNRDHWFPKDYQYVLMMNVAFGLAVLTKGPIGLIVPTAIVGMFLLIQRLEPLQMQRPNDHGRLSGLIWFGLRVINPVHFLKTCWL